MLQWTDDWFIDYTSDITPPRLDSFNVDRGATLLQEGRTIRKVMGGGGGEAGEVGEVQKNIRAREN